MKHILLTLLLTAVLPWVRGEGSRPNILFLFTDDQSPYMIGYDNPEIKTPVMDGLAAKGVIFDRFYTNTAICMASRATVQTGMYELKTGCNFTHGSLATAFYQKSYPVLLRKSGYYTGFIGKFGFAVQDDPAKSSYSKMEDLALAAREFDFWGGWPSQGKVVTAEALNEKVRQHAGEYPHVTRAVGATAQDFFREAATTGKPFCLSVSFKVPHSPYVADKAFDDLYPPSYSFKRRPNFDTYEGLPPQAISDRQFPKGEKWVRQYDKLMGIQARMVHGVDVAIGMMVEELEALGLADNTVIIFTTDNGYFQGAHRLGGKVLPYEEGSRAPTWMVDLREKRATSGQRVADVGSTVDIAPTILELAGLPVSANMDGKSLLPYFDDTEAGVNQDALLIQCWSGHKGDEPRALSVVTKEWKYIYWFYEGKGIKPVEELFNLMEDPYEMNNLAGCADHRAVLDNMRRRYDAYVALIQAEGVDFNDYGRYKVLYDRKIPYQEKKRFMRDAQTPKPKKKS